MDVGHLAAVHRYPLKSAAGEALATVEVTGAGLADDRRWLLVDDAGTPVTAREAPGLRDVAVDVETGRLRVGLAEGPGLQGPRDVDAALSALVGRAVRLRDTGTVRQPDAAAVHLVSAGAEADPRAPAGCDPEPRANLVLDLSGSPGSERGWSGRRLRVGVGDTAVLLRVTRTPKRCLGVYAEVDRPGTVATGDPVELLDD